MVFFTLDFYQKKKKKKKEKKKSENASITIIRSDPFDNRICSNIGSPINPSSLPRAKRGKY
jgi:hypothetical protein